MSIKVRFLSKENSWIGIINEDEITEEKALLDGLLISISREYRKECELFLEKISSSYTSKVVQGWFNIDKAIREGLSEEEYIDLKDSLVEEFNTSGVLDFKEFLQMKVDYFFSEEVENSNDNLSCLINNEFNRKKVQSRLYSVELYEEVVLDLKVEKWLELVEANQSKIQPLLEMVGSLEYIKEKVDRIKELEKQVAIVVIEKEN